MHLYPSLANVVNIKSCKNEYNKLINGEYKYITFKWNGLSIDIDSIGNISQFKHEKLSLNYINMILNHWFKSDYIKIIKNIVFQYTVPKCDSINSFINDMHSKCNGQRILRYGAFKYNDTIIVALYDPGSSNLDEYFRVSIHWYHVCKNVFTNNPAKITCYRNDIITPQLIHNAYNAHQS